MTYTVQTKLERKGNGIKVEDAITFFRSLEKNKISSGIHSEEGQEYVKRAAHTEFGTTVFEPWDTPFGKVHVVPPRPAIRMSLYPDMKKEVTNTYQDNINNEKRTKLKTPVNNAIKVQEKVGEKCVELQQNKMYFGNYDQSTNTTGLDPEHNGIRTIAYKGFDDPWIQTGETVSKVNYKVTKK